MEEKRYPKLDEEDGSILKANDASEAVAYAYDCTESKNIPGLPENWDDLILSMSLVNALLITLSLR